MANTTITVNLIPKAMKALLQAARLTGDSRTDTINRALQAYAYMESEKSKGNKIKVQDKGGDLWTLHWE